jgi:DNA-binding response OmpR family regulator
MSNARVLVVDDDPNMLSMLRRTLGFEGFAVTTGADGEHALRTIELERPDLVVLDVMLLSLLGSLWRWLAVRAAGRWQLGMSRCVGIVARDVLTRCVVIFHG